MFGGNRETGRHKGEPAEDKISSITCTCMCHLNEVETLKKHALYYIVLIMTTTEIAYS